MSRARRLSRGSLIVACFVTLARPCGGPPPPYPIVEATMPLSTAASLGDPNDEEDHEDYSVPEEYLFLQPFRLALGARLGRAWNIAYGGEEYGWRTGDWSNWSDTKVPAYVDKAPFESAIRLGALPAADKAAAAIVQEILDMPEAQAQGNQPALRRAVEWLELRPRLGGVPPAALRAFFLGEASQDPLPPILEEAREIRTLDRAGLAAFAQSHPKSPRIASLRFVALQEEMKTRIANGWGEEIVKNTPPETWDRLETEQALWLRTFPTHPLADLVRLMRVRLCYLHRDARGAWKPLLEMYPRHAPRVAYEMRYLTRNDMVDSKLLDEKMPAEVASAIVSAVMTVQLPYYERYRDPSSFDSASWSRLWARAHAMPRGDLRANFEERLLRALVLSPPAPLPAGFPDRPEGLSPGAGKNRLDILIRLKSWDAARAQAVALGTLDAWRVPRIQDHLARGEMDQAWKLAVEAGPAAAYYRARIRLERRESPAAVLAENGFGWPARRYLLRVLWTEKDIAPLVDAKDPGVRADAREAAATRAAAAGDWARGRRLMAGDPSRGTVWARAEALHAGAGGSGDALAWARFLVSARGALFYERDFRWQESLEARLEEIRGGERNAEGSRGGGAGVTRWSRDEEAAAIERSLLESNELYAALQVYVAWLQKSRSNSVEARRVLGEADAAYNRLINQGESIPAFWKKRLEDDGTAPALRRIGAGIRSGRV